VIVHVAPEADIAYWVESVPPQAQALIAAFWPGPLTLILPRAAHIPDQVSGGQSSIGLRCPSHPVAQALLREFKSGKGGIAGPSANKFGHVSPTTAQHVRDEFDADGDSPIACILDGGQSEVGIESTIIDLSRLASHGPVLLRPGHISAAQIGAVLGVAVQAADAAAPRASGTLESHYAPRTPVLLVPSAQLAATLQQMRQAGQSLALISYSTLAKEIPPLAAQFPMAASAPAYAHDLYAALRNMDHAAADLIVVEAPPSDPDWQGINDRLRRAAHDSSAVLAGFKK
jgi:L-threonylcarbamoyladenylate synthase